MSAISFSAENPAAVAITFPRYVPAAAVGLTNEIHACFTVPAGTANETFLPSPGLSAPETRRPAFVQVNTTSRQSMFAAAGRPSTDTVNVRSASVGFERFTAAERVSPRIILTATAPPTSPPGGTIPHMSTLSQRSQHQRNGFVKPLARATCALNR